jgi:hypothetical protein
MKKILIKKVIAISIISFLFVQIFYVTVVEPTVASAVTNNVVVTLNVDAGVSISTATNATMTPDISMTQSKSIGSTSWTVATNNAAGYLLAVHASTQPALHKPAGPGAADDFADYTPAVGGTPETWVSASSAVKKFGFSARGTDALVSYGGASTCGNAGTGVPDGSEKFLGFNGGTDITIATKNTVTTPSGVVTNICFAAEQGSGIYALSGAFTATITGTATVI